eukprot:jgi/Ulvmu1/4768/UM020_0053.1
MITVCAGARAGHALPAAAMRPSSCNGMPAKLINGTPLALIRKSCRSRSTLHASSSTSPTEYAVWPNPAPELTDLPVAQDATEELPDRFQRYAKVSLSAGLLVLADQGMKRVMLGLGLQFPHTLAGMLVVVALSVSAKAAGGAAADATDSVIAFFGPLRDWVARWMPVFFVPSLISLPHATASLSAADIACIAQVIVTGWAASLLLATFAIKATRNVAHSTLTQDEAKDTTPRPVSPFSPSHYLTWAFISIAALGVSAALPQHTDVLRTAFLLASVCKGYLLGVAVPRRLKLLLHPIVVCTLYTTACCHLWAAVSGSTYSAVLSAFMAKDAVVPGSGALLMSMLVVVVLCDGMRVYLQRSVVRRHGLEILGTVVAAALFSMFATAKLAVVAGLGPQVARSLVPRSVTAPLALPIADMLGGIPSLAAASVCFTGLLGAAFGQVLMTRLGLRDEISRGVAQACSAHGLGAAAMAATESQALPFCAVTIAAMGTVSNVLLCVPVVRGALLAVTG